MNSIVTMDPVITKLLVDFRLVFADLIRAVLHLPPADAEGTDGADL